MRRYDTDEEGVMTESARGMYAYVADVDTLFREWRAMAAKIPHALNCSHVVIKAGAADMLHVIPGAGPCNCDVGALLASMDQVLTGE